MKAFVEVTAVGTANRDAILRYFGLACDLAGGVRGPGVTGYKFLKPAPSGRGARYCDFRTYSNPEWVFHLFPTVTPDALSPLCGATPVPLPSGSYHA